MERIREEKTRLVKEKKIKADKHESVIFKGDDNKYFENTEKGVVCINDEIPFEIPDNWEWVRFKNIVQFSLGKTPERGETQYWQPPKYCWVSIADMEDKKILYKTKEKVSEIAYDEKFNGKISPIGTLLMSFKLTIGKVSILGIDAFHNEAIISIYPYIDKENALRNYLYHTLCIITGFISTTEAIKGATLNSAKIAEMLIPLPPQEEQKRIIFAIDHILTSIMRG